MGFGLEGGEGFSIVIEFLWTKKLKHASKFRIVYKTIKKKNF